MKTFPWLAAFLLLAPATSHGASFTPKDACDDAIVEAAERVLASKAYSENVVLDLLFLPLVQGRDSLDTEICLEAGIHHRRLEEIRSAIHSLQRLKDGCGIPDENLYPLADHFFETYARMGDFCRKSAKESPVKQGDRGSLKDAVQEIRNLLDKIRQYMKTTCPSCV